MSVLDTEAGLDDSQTEQPDSAAKTLMGLFQPHPFDHSTIKKIEGTEKDAPCEYESASLKVYENHLSPDSFSGVGGLGMCLGQLVPVEGKNLKEVIVVWVTMYVALDFDAHLPAQVRKALLDTLTSLSIYIYLSIGTSGRGTYLYIFFDSNLSQRQAYTFVTLLQSMAQDAGLGAPEVRPSSAYGKGSPIFLPYRGANADGYGYNPLLDASGDLRPIALCDAFRQIRLTIVDDVLAFIDRFEKNQKNNKRSEEPKKKPRGDPCAVQVTSIETSEQHLAVFLAELERIAPYFVQGKRQNLIMGVAAYGVRGLRLSDQVVIREIKTFMDATDGDEWRMRLEALNRTLAKHRQGQHVAWRYYYTLAEVEAPPGPIETPAEEVLMDVERARELLERQIWPPRTGLTDRAAFAALLTYATSFGCAHEAGLSVSVSTRDLALKAGVSHQTLLKALIRLAQQGLIRRGETRSVLDSGSVVVLISKVSKLHHSIGAWGGLNEWSILHTHPAFRHGRLNKSSIDPLTVLIDAGQALTRFEIARRIGKKSRALSKPLAKLIEFDLVFEHGRRYEVVSDWSTALDCAAQKTGALFVEQQDKNLYEVQRDAYRRLVKRTQRKE